MLTKGKQVLRLVNWEFAYTLSNDCTLDNTLNMFLVQTSPQNHTYKYILYNSRLVETELYVFCEETKDTILHLFCDCNKVNKIWLKIYVQLHVQCGRVYDLYGRCIRLGIENIDFLYNSILLIGKTHIYQYYLRSCTTSVENDHSTASVAKMLTYSLRVQQIMGSSTVGSNQRLSN